LHVNSKDISLVEVLKQKINQNPDLIDNSERLINRILNENTTRMLDLVIPLENPVLISQNVFYTSNTGGIASKKADQVLNTKSILDEYLPDRINNLFFIGFIDGQGWIDMSSSLNKAFNNFDDFFQIKTTDTKLRLLLREKGVLTPLDIELAVFITSNGKFNANKYVVFKRIQNIFSITSIKLEKYLYFLIDSGYIYCSSDKLIIPKKREKLIRMFYVLDLLLLDGFEEYNRRMDNQPIDEVVFNCIDTNNELTFNEQEINDIIQMMNERFLIKTFNLC